jgi:hypothetical protein
MTAKESSAQTHERRNLSINAEFVYSGAFAWGTAMHFHLLRRMETTQLMTTKLGTILIVTTGAMKFVRI